VTVLLQASYRGSKERQLLRTFEKATLPGGFFVSETTARGAVVSILMMHQQKKLPMAAFFMSPSGVRDVRLSRFIILLDEGAHSSGCFRRAIHYQRMSPRHYIAMTGKSSSVRLNASMATYCHLSKVTICHYI